MPVRLRLQRFGRTHAPIYRVVAADSRAPRDGRFIEIVGTYNPRPDEEGRKHVTLNVERVKYWLAVGAQPSDRVGRLLAKRCTQAALMPAVPKAFLGVKSPSVLPPNVTALEAAAAAARKAPIAAATAAASAPAKA